jgi:hypothetical protein
MPSAVVLTARYLTSNGNRAQRDDGVPQDEVNLGRNGVFTL